MTDRALTAEQIVRALPLPRRPAVAPCREPLVLGNIRPATSDDSMTYALGHADQSGRISARTLIHDLGWSIGDQLSIDALTDTLVLTRTPHGTYPVRSTHFVQLPHSTRKAVGIEAGDAVLLAAAPAHSLLLAHTRTAIDLMISSHLRSQPTPSTR